GEQLARAPDEWNALDVFVGARRLAHEHQVGVRIAHAEHDLRASERMQFAARAVADLGADLPESVDLRQRDDLFGRRVWIDTAAGVPPPLGIAADAGNAELLRESKMFDELVAVHHIRT